MWQPNDNDSPSSHYGSEEKQQSSSSQEDRLWLWDFQKCYVDDYIADKEKRLEEDNKKKKLIHIYFEFQESSPIPDINISPTLYLYNPQQFESTLSHYYDQSNGLYPISNYTKYNELQTEIDKRKISQSNIDKSIDELSQYLTFILEGNYKSYITYTNLNRSTLSLAIGHLQSILLVLKTWSYRESDSNEIDSFMTELSKQRNESLLYKPFQTHYIDSLLYLQSESPLIMLRINFNFKKLGNNTKKSLKKILNIRNMDQFKTILRFYNSNIEQDFVPFKPSSKYKDLYTDIIYCNTLQVRMNKILQCLGICFKIEEDIYDPLTLNLDYYGLINRLLTFGIKHLELLTITFKTWNDDENDRDAMDLYLSVMKDEFLPLLKDKSWKSSWTDYMNILNIVKKLNSNTLQLNLHIILKQYQRTITKTLQLQELKRFIDLLDYYNYLPNGYLPSSNSFDKSLSKLLYIFEQDENDPSILNLYYYPLSNELNTSFIIRHLTLMVSFFKDFEDTKTNDIFEAYQCLSSIAIELNSLSNSKFSLPKLHLPQPSPLDPSLFNPSLINNNNTQLSISTPMNLTHNPTKNTQLSISTPVNLSFPTSNPSLNKTSTTKSSIPFTTSSPSLLSNPFWSPHNPTDPTTVLPSSLTLHLRLLPFDNLRLKDTLHFQDISRLLSILDHYSLIPNTFNHPGSNDFKVSNMIKIQKDLNTTLLDLSDRILFSYDKLSNNPNLHLTYSNLKSKDIPSALLHLELMVRVFKTWSYDRHGTKVLNDFVAKARSTIIPRIPYDDDKVTGSITTTLPTDRDHPQVLGSLVPMDPSGPMEVRASDGNLGGASANFPNLLDLAGEDISMMGDVD